MARDGTSLKTHEGDPAPAGHGAGTPTRPRLTASRFSSRFIPLLLAVSLLIGSGADTAIAANRDGAGSQVRPATVKSAANATKPRAKKAKRAKKQAAKTRAAKKHAMQKQMQSATARQAAKSRQLRVARTAGLSAAAAVVQPVTAPVSETQPAVEEVVAPAQPVGTGTAPVTTNSTLASFAVPDNGTGETTANEAASTNHKTTAPVNDDVPANEPIGNDDPAPGASGDEEPTPSGTEAESAPTMDPVPAGDSGSPPASDEAPQIATSPEPPNDEPLSDSPAPSLPDAGEPDPTASVDSGDQGPVEETIDSAPIPEADDDTAAEPGEDVTVPEVEPVTDSANGVTTEPEGEATTGLDEEASTEPALDAPVEPFETPEVTTGESFEPDAPIADLVVEAITNDDNVTPGQSNGYRFRITNPSASDIQVRISATSSLSGWTSDLRATDGATKLPNVFTVNGGESIEIIVVVSVPANAIDGETNSTMLTIVPEQITTPGAQASTG